MTAHAPFVVTVTLVTPLAGSVPMTLDALLAGELAQWEGDEAALTSLPLGAMDGTFQASQAYVDAVGIDMKLTKIAMRQSEPNSMPVDSIQGPIVTTYNAAKNTLNRYNGRATYTVMFAGVGDIDAVHGILIDVQAIGLRRGDGLGLVATLTIEPVPADPTRWGLVTDEGEPMRPVPLPLWRRLGGRADVAIQQVRCRPFYWDQRNPAVACAVPVRNEIHELTRCLAA